MYHIPHIIITSVQLDISSSSTTTTTLIVGSTARSDGSSRLFKISIPSIDCFFTGTGDMFAALAVVRLREAAVRQNITQVKSWVSPDNVKAVDLPLAKAAEKVLGSMQAILQKTKLVRDDWIAREGEEFEVGEDEEKISRLRKTRAAEIRVTRYLKELRHPEERWKAEEWDGLEEHR